MTLDHFHKDLSLGTRHVFQWLGEVLFYFFLDLFSMFSSLGRPHTFCFAFVTPVKLDTLNGVRKHLCCVPSVAHVGTVFLIIGKNTGRLDGYFRNSGYYGCVSSLNPYSHHPAIMVDNGGIIY